MRFQFATVEFHSIVVPQRVAAKQELSQREGSFLCSLSTRLFTSKSSVFARGSNPTLGFNGAARTDASYIAGNTMKRRLSPRPLQGIVMRSDERTSQEWIW